MELPTALKNKWLLLGVAVGIGVLLFSRQSSGAASLSPAAIMGYDKDLIALGQQTALERDRMNATLQMAQIASDTELAGKNSDNQTALGLVSLTSQADLEALKLNNQSSRDLLNDSAYRQTLQTDLESNWLYKLTGLTGEQKYNQTALETDRSLQMQNIVGYQNLQMQNIVGYQNLQLASVNTSAQLEQARIAGNASVSAAKAGKSKSIGCCGFSLSI